MDFAKKVKRELALSGKTQTEFVEDVAREYNGRLDASVISRAINGGDNVYPQVKLAIARVLHIQF